MTREQLFTTSFEPQFQTHMGFASEGLEGSRPIGSGDLPGFEVVPGETIYSTYDMFGYPLTGRQSFGLRLLWSHPQLDISGRLAARSDLIGEIESFFAGNYTPPAPGPSDTVRIDSIKLVRIDPPALRKLDTRSVISAVGEYYFTIL